MGSSDDVLEAIGIGQLEEDVYGSIVDHGPSSVSELVRHQGVTSARTRKAIKALVDRGLINQAADGNRYVAVTPGVALGALIAQRMEQLESARLALVHWDERFRRHEMTRNPIDLLEIVGSNENRGQRFLQLTSAARDEILILDKPPYWAPPRSYRTEFKAALERGVTYRTIYDKRSLEYDGRLDDIRASMRTGEDSSVHRDLPVKLAIFDRRIALLSFTSDLSHDTEGALIVHASSLLDALVSLWRLLRSQSTALETTIGGVEEVGSTAAGRDVDDRIITMLLGGHKVETIARQLSLGKSTVDRHVGKIIRSLGAETRFQAGYRLAEQRLRGAEGNDATNS